MTPTTLTPGKRHLLDRLAGEVDAALGSFEAQRKLIWGKLEEIREKVFAGDRSTFMDFCKVRWGWGEAYVYRLIAANKVETNLSPIGETVANEAQARQLAPHPPEIQRAAWLEASAAGPPKASRLGDILTGLSAQAKAEKIQEAHDRAQLRIARETTQAQRAWIAANRVAAQKMRKRHPAGLWELESHLDGYLLELDRIEEKVSSE